MNPPLCWLKDSTVTTSLLESLLLPFPVTFRLLGDDPYGLALVTSLPPPTCPTSQLIHRLASLASANVSFSFLGTLGGGGQRTRISLERGEEGSTGKTVTLHGSPPRQA